MRKHFTRHKKVFAAETAPKTTRAEVARAEAWNIIFKSEARAGTVSSVLHRNHRCPGAKPPGKKNVFRRCAETSRAKTETDRKQTRAPMHTWDLETTATSLTAQNFANGGTQARRIDLCTTRPRNAVRVRASELNVRFTRKHSTNALHRSGFQRRQAQPNQCGQKRILFFFAKVYQSCTDQKRTHARVAGVKWLATREC